MADKNGHIVVVGGGVMGLACAWRLARGGAGGGRVTVVEARECGGGATLASLGALWPAGPLVNGPLQRLHRASLWEFAAFVRELEEASGQGVRYRRLGRVEYLDSEKAVARAKEEVAACLRWPTEGGLPAREVLDGAEMGRRFPMLAVGPFGGVLCRATAQVVVSDLVAALGEAARRAGAEIREKTKVMGLEIVGESVRGVMTAGGRIEADAVLVTAGAWSGMLSPAARVRPAKGQGLALRMPAGLALEGIIKRETIYLVPWHEQGEILVGSTTEPEAGFDEAPTAEARALLVEGAARIVPALAGAEVLRQWAGLRPQNPAKRHPPIMGRDPRVGNLFVCTGHFKTGIGMAPAASRLMAELFDGGPTGALLPFQPRG